jgi:hypothetical protein
MQNRKIHSKKISNEFIETVEGFRYFGTRITVNYSVNRGGGGVIGSRWNAGNAYEHSVQNLSLACLSAG